MGRELQKVAPIRTSDGTGRHTTTTRQLIELPGGALLIDTPGMRELQPWADESAVVRAFGRRRAVRPRLPGCAVAEAIADGRCDPARLDHYRHLIREAEFEERKRDKAAAAREKHRWKRIMQDQRARYRDRERH